MSHLGGGGMGCVVNSLHDLIDPCETWLYIPNFHFHTHLRNWYPGHFVWNEIILPKRVLWCNFSFTIDARLNLLSTYGILRIYCRHIFGDKQGDVGYSIMQNVIEYHFQLSDILFYLSPMCRIKQGFSPTYLVDSLSLRWRRVRGQVDDIMVHYNGVIMGAMVSQITSLTSVYSTVYSGAD